MNITLKPFVLNFISSLAKCQNATESDMKWWDNSTAQFMVQMQTNNSQGFCRQTKNVQSLYIMSADAHQFYGQGVIDTDMLLPNASGLVNYTICTQADSSIFLAEFLTKINSEKLYSCQHQYSQRFDIRLQQCMLKYDNAVQPTNMAKTNHFLTPFFLSVYLFLYVTYFLA
ncbi:unnamed protein product [Adineta steineri]|nr:unnamed protein product [Adineta steineri]